MRALAPPPLYGKKSAKKNFSFCFKTIKIVLGTTIWRNTLISKQWYLLCREPSKFHTSWTSLTRLGWLSQSLFNCPLSASSTTTPSRPTSTDAFGGLFPTATSNQLRSHWFAGCPGGGWFDQSDSSIPASQWFGGGYCVNVFNESFVVGQFGGRGENWSLSDFLSSDGSFSRLGTWRDQGSPILESFANRLDFENFQTSQAETSISILWSLSSSSKI